MLKKSTSLWMFLVKNRFGLLFITLLLSLGGSAVFAELGLNRISNSLILLNLAVLLIIVSGGLTLWISLGLFTLYVIFWVLSQFIGIEVFMPAKSVIAAILLLMGIYSCFRSIFRSGPVDRERMAAALSLYLLLGLIFALIFAVIEELQPGSIHFPETLYAGTGDVPFSDMIYFSFVTLATLGYGDIVPLSAPARDLVILEAVIGQIYLVVVVARMVSLYGKSENH